MFKQLAMSDLFLLNSSRCLVSLSSACKSTQLNCCLCLVLWYLEIGFSLVVLIRVLQIMSWIQLQSPNPQPEKSQQARWVESNSIRARVIHAPRMPILHPYPFSHQVFVTHPIEGILLACECTRLQIRQKVALARWPADKAICLIHSFIRWSIKATHRHLALITTTISHLAVKLPFASVHFGLQRRHNLPLAWRQSEPPYWLLSVGANSNKLGWNCKKNKKRADIEIKRPLSGSMRGHANSMRAYSSLLSKSIAIAIGF